jgi:predicted flavoprotein YhiN
MGGMVSLLGYLQKEDDGRMFPVTDTSATVIDCLLNEVQRLGVKLRNGANVLSVRKSSNGAFEVTLGPVTRPSVMTSDFLMLATGSAQRVRGSATSVMYKTVLMAGHNSRTFFVDTTKAQSLFELNNVWIRCDLFFSPFKRRKTRKHASLAKT